MAARDFAESFRLVTIQSEKIVFEAGAKQT